MPCGLMVKSSGFDSDNIGSSPIGASKKQLRVNAAAACQSHNLEDIGSSPIPATWD